MKVRIKTAHGYLSFQPDGRLEYRASGRTMGGNRHRRPGADVRCRTRPNRIPCRTRHRIRGSAAVADARLRRGGQGAAAGAGRRSDRAVRRFCHHEEGRMGSRGTGAWAALEAVRQQLRGLRDRHRHVPDRAVDRRHPGRRRRRQYAAVEHRRHGRSRPLAAGGQSWLGHELEPEIGARVPVSSALRGLVNAKTRQCHEFTGFVPSIEREEAL